MGRWPEGAHSPQSLLPVDIQYHKKLKDACVHYLGWLGIFVLERQRAGVAEVGKVSPTMVWRMCRAPLAWAGRNDGVQGEPRGMERAKAA